MKLNIVQRLGNVKIGRRLGLGFATIVVIMTAMLGTVEYRAYQSEKITSDIVENNVAKLAYLNTMANSVHIVSRVIRSVMLLKDDPTAAANERVKIDKARSEYDKTYAALLGKKISEEGRLLVNKIDAAKVASRPLNNKVLALADEKKFDEALKVLLEEARPAVQAWQDAIDEYGTLQQEQTEQADIEIADGNKRARLINTVLAVLAALLATGLAFVIGRSVTSPLQALQTAIQDVRDGGSLGALANIKTKDELGDMGFAVNALLQAQISAREQADEERKKAEAENERLNNSVIAILQAVNQLSQRDLTARAPVTQDVIGTVSDSINALTDETSKVLAGVNLIAAQVATASGNVKTQGDMVSKTAADERVSVGKMIDSLTESTQTTNQMAALAEQSNRSAEQATMATDNALETVNGTVKGMESIRETIAETEKRIKRLGERSQEITGIVNLINTISERTHVLALNASMQAAVAGEAGRGFAVVAEEVQRLAESSRNATQQIGTLVNNIQLETNETISTVNRTIGQVVQGSEQAQKAGEQMRRTQQITGELVAQVKRIAEASELQKLMSVGLLKSVQHIGESSNRTSQQIDAQNVETESLLSSAKRLVASVAVFKLPQAA
jgi:methyl-accepting chemotaxis protein